MGLEEHPPNTTERHEKHMPGSMAFAFNFVLLSQDVPVDIRGSIPGEIPAREHRTDHSSPPKATQNVFLQEKRSPLVCASSEDDRRRKKTPPWVLRVHPRYVFRKQTRWLAVPDGDTLLKDRQEAHRAVKEKKRTPRPCFSKACTLHGGQRSAVTQGWR